jgi:hypothetical protein
MGALLHALRQQQGVGRHGLCALPQASVWGQSLEGFAQT